MPAHQATSTIHEKTYPMWQSFCIVVPPRRLIHTNESNALCEQLRESKDKEWLVLFSVDKNRRQKNIVSLSDTVWSVFDQSTRISMCTVSAVRYILHNKMDSHAPKFNYIFSTSMSNCIWFDVAIVFTQAAVSWIRITRCKKETQNYIRINNKVAIYSSYT